MRRRVVPIGRKEKCKVTSREKELSSELDLRIAILAADRDGSKGLYSGIKKVFRDNVFIQRCQWHNNREMLSIIYPKVCSKHGAGSFKRPTKSPPMKRLRKRSTGLRQNLC